MTTNATKHTPDVTPRSTAALEAVAAARRSEKYEWKHHDALITSHVKLEMDYNAVRAENAELRAAVEKAEAFIDGIKVYGKDDVAGGLYERQKIRNALRAALAKAKG